MRIKKNKLKIPFFFFLYSSALAGKIYSDDEISRMQERNDFVPDEIIYPAEMAPMLKSQGFNLSDFKFTGDYEEILERTQQESESLETRALQKMTDNNGVDFDDYWYYWQRTE